MCQGSLNGTLPVGLEKDFVSRTVSNAGSISFPSVFEL